MVILALLFWIPGLLGAWWMLRVHVVADEHGLHWRGMGRWKTASWPQIRDYDLRLMSGSPRPWRTVYTASGTLRFNGQVQHHGEILTNTYALCQAIEERAQWAKSRGWHIQNTGFENGPRIFIQDGAAWRTFWLALGLSLLLIPLNLSKSGSFSATPAHFAQMWHDLGWPLNLVFVLTFIVMALMLPVLLTSVHLGVARASSERRGQRIIADEAGLTFEGRECVLRAQWHEVTDYYLDNVGKHLLLPARCVVVTQNGNFDFVGLKEQSQLRAIIQRYATQAAHQEWKQELLSETLGSEASRWSYGFAGVGARIYSYKTRTNRAMLILGSFMSLMLLLSTVMRAHGIGLHSKADIVTGVIGLIITFVPTIFGWLYYFAASVRTDDYTLEKRTPFSRRSLNWDEVRAFYRVSGYPGSISVVEGDAVTLRFASLVAEADELCDEIARRAVNSQSRDWQTPSQSSQSTANSK